jgi:hypothetical protein
MCRRYFSLQLTLQKLYIVLGSQYKTSSCEMHLAPEWSFLGLANIVSYKHTKSQCENSSYYVLHKNNKICSNLKIWNMHCSLYSDPNFCQILCRSKIGNWDFDVCRGLHHTPLCTSIFVFIFLKLVNMIFFVFEKQRIVGAQAMNLYSCSCM